MDYYDIGIVYQNLKQYDIALEYFLKSFTIFEKQRPNDHMNIGRLLHSIGKSYRLKGDFFRAELYLITARNVREKDMPKNHTTTSSTYFELASLYYDQHCYLMTLNYAKKST
ncbi:unnamed protein product [Rotaria sp. Silwood2]|nr:unnamed protein product [Rotaria sp. Silwood2]CAF2999163.1 unnamed protein product [Rotaria sp. Silwood2]CAF3248522.1 unnamed protein product [Rotaria sp. Silwood2]CAF4060307.1 unnamed protein product [Rotaria sp. Silwood2]CAF4174037.1 unnamed protein product [Rotaria sp. Silwood2]